MERFGRRISTVDTPRLTVDRFRTVTRRTILVLSRIHSGSSHSMIGSSLRLAKRYASHAKRAVALVAIAVTKSDILPLGTPVHLLTVRLLGLRLLALACVFPTEKTCPTRLINFSRGVSPGTLGNFIFSLGILYPVAALLYISGARLSPIN